ncbi:hypothetical protein FQN54_006885 [Arachnomyces sp. PD_36]|nr:hypothetical protein FQN54_006885 [Arachnomyces sp. PD_36]
MARHRTSTATNGSAVHIMEPSYPAESPESSRATISEPPHSMDTSQTGGRPSSYLQESGNDSGSEKPKQPATIRFYAYQDPNNSRPSLPFTPMTRTLPSDTSIIRVGRYSERDGIPVPNPSEPSDEPVGFKSKVVSRKHCEFSLVNGQWHIRDVGSSSGTFLNHMRLSQPNMESRHYAVRDGDIVQLGIDFRGGEEMIFRSVRIRIECNRMWQQRANEFNKNTETLISNLGKGNAEGYAGCRECSICLGSVLRPYQCLFMAACAHVWHYKCIRRLIHTPEYPMFQCPNCRAYTDLSAEVDDSNDSYEAPPTAPPNGLPASESTNGVLSNGDLNPPRPGLDDANLAAMTEHLNLQSGGTPRRSDDNPSSNHADGPVTINTSSTSEEPGTPERRTTRGPNIVIPDSGSPATHLAVSSQSTGTNRRLPTRSETPVSSDHMEDGPLTPRNDSGPLAFDGHAGRL